jgi:outer membrane protein assembly factor BamB
MKMQKTLLALALILTIAASAFAAIPNIFGQVTTEKIGTQTVVYAFPHTIGLNQEMMIQGLLYPPPPYDVEAYIWLERPDGTEVWFNFTWTSDNDIKEKVIYYEPDMLGVWRLRIGWDGDDQYYGDTSEFRRRIYVQQEPVEYPPTTVQPYAFVGTVPGDKIGLGEYIYIVGWVSPPRELQGGIYHDNPSFVITKPDGTKDTISKKLDSPATASIAYLCDQEGTYSVVLDFPEQDWGAPFLTQLPAVSPPATWECEEGYVAPTYPDYPLPTGKWSWPISGEYREWYQISGAWLNDKYDASQSYFNPYTKGPNTPHVLWTMQVDLGGIMGGEMGNKFFEPDWEDCVMLAGRLYYMTEERAVTTEENRGTRQGIMHCLDIFTGEELWAKPLPGPGGAGNMWVELQHEPKIDPRQAVEPDQIVAIWIDGSGLWRINPFNGDCTFYDPDLRMDRYHDHAFYGTYMNNTDAREYLYKWSTITEEVLWNASMGREWRYGDVIDTTQDPPVFVRVGSEYGSWPRVTWIKSWNTETGELIANGTDVGLTSPEGLPSGRTIVGWGKAYIHEMDMKVHAIDIYTGQEAWVSDKAQDYPWGDFNAYNIARGYNMVFFNSWDGHIYAYDVDTGKELWKAYSGDSLGETAMGTYPFWGKTVVGDGKLYAGTSEHSPPNPTPRGNSLFCIDAFTGDIIWQLEHFREGGDGMWGLHSGVLTCVNEYDGMLYAFGKGDTKTTVMVGPKVVPKGSKVVIEGTVTDESPAAKGTPAIADEFQAEWTNYLHMNLPKPTHATGVDVLLQAVMPDHSVVDIGWVKSDIMGHYEFLWTPPEEGAYKILATFHGSESYWMSSAETALGVGPAPAPAAPIEPEPEPEAPLMTTELAIIIAVAVIAVIGVVSYWYLRKRK